MKPGRWPAGDSEMARLVRTHDWAETPLGPIEGWARGLKALVDLVLASESVMCLMWGERAISIYNDAYASAIGARHPGALGRPAFETWADVRPVFEPLFERAYGAGETAAERDLRFSFAGGVPREEAWFDLTYTPVPDERGNVLGVLATLVETTERVLAVRELADTKAMLEESEARYRAFVTASSDVVYRMGPDWAEMRRLDGRGFISDTAEPTQDWMGRYIHPDDRAPVKAAIGEAVRTKGVFELEHRVVRADGTLGWTLSRAVPIMGAQGEVLEWLGTASDVTARKEGEERRAFLLELSDAIRPLADPVEVQEVAMRMLGERLALGCAFYLRAERDDTGWVHVVESDYHRAPGMPSVVGRHRLEAFGSSVFAGMEHGKTIEVSDVDALPGLTPEELRSYSAFGLRAFVNVPLVKGGEYVAAVCVHDPSPRDWTAAETAMIREVAERTWAAVERACAEEALRESEERYRLAVEAADLGRWELVPDTGEFYTSPTCNRHLGLPEDAQPTHEGHFGTIHPDDRAMIHERLRRAAEGGVDFEAEYRVLGPGGGVRLILSRARTLRDGGSTRTRLIGVTLDVTEARELKEERERARSRELTAMAEAAERERISRELHDRVAHHMAVAHQSLELFAALRESATERAEERLALAQESARLALDQTRALSAELKRLQEEELEDGLGVAFRALAGSSVPEDMRLEVSVTGEESAIPDAIAMQVYLAMREAIRNAVRHSGCSRIGVALEVRDGEVVGRVQDDGGGFDPEAVGEATPSWGVGLVSMKERAEMLGGSFRVESKRGEGASAEVRVPLNGGRR